MSRKTKLLISSALFISVLVIDQIIKIAVKTGMQLGEHIEVTSWFHFAFVENNGMAFGWELFGGKLILTLFRLVAVSVIGWFIWREIMRRRPTGYIICLTLIMAGAAVIAYIIGEGLVDAAGVGALEFEVEEEAPPDET